MEIQSDSRYSTMDDVESAPASRPHVPESPPTGDQQHLIAAEAMSEDEVEYELEELKTPPVFVKGERVHWEVIFVTLSVFMGYAILVSFQHDLKHKLAITDGDEHRSNQFSFGVSFLYIGNLVFRMAHNFLFGCMVPRHRVYVSMVSMVVAMLTLGVGVFLLNIHHMSAVFIAYALGGISVGSFESNLLSAITPLGHETKVWAIVGLPLGFSAVLVGGFILTALGVPVFVIYLLVLAMLVVGASVFFVSIPAYTIEHNTASFADFAQNVREWRHWLPRIWKHSLALMLDMFCVSLFSGIMLYIFNAKKVPLVGFDRALVPQRWFFVVHNLFTLVGDSTSRRLAYRLKPRNPFIFLVLSVLGAALCLSRVALVAPLGIFFVFFANGSVYATATRHIDVHVEGKYNLIALSTWLFVGDLGSVAGSNLLQHIRFWVCDAAREYVCASD